MEILPSLASLSGLTLLISVLIVFIKIFDENHKQYIASIKLTIHKDYNFPQDNPVWKSLYINYEEIRNTCALSLIPIVKISFGVLTALSIVFFIIFLLPDISKDYLRWLFIFASIVVMGTYFCSIWFFRKMSLQKRKLSQSMEDFESLYKMVNLAIKHEKTKGE